MGTTRKTVKKAIVKATHKSITTSVGQEKVKEEDSNEVTNFETTPAVVGVSFGLTINLGNFESARVDVIAHVPCCKEDIDKVYESTKQWVASKVEEEVSAIRNYKKKV